MFNNVTMLECNAIFNPFCTLYMPTCYIHFIYLFNPNTKYRDMYRIHQISQKIQIWIFAHIAHSPTLKKRAFGNILLKAPSCGLRREAKSFFFLIELMPFKLKYNSNFDNILVKNSNLVFQPIWQPSIYSWSKNFTHTLQNLQKFYYFTKIRGIIQNAWYYLVLTWIRFHIKDVYM